MTIGDARRFNAWIVVQQAEDVPGQWLAHCLDFDLFALGENPQQAMEMIAEAISIAVADDVLHKRDINAHSAPVEFWEKLKEIQRFGSPRQGLPSEAEGYTHIALQVGVDLRVFGEVVQFLTPTSWAPPATPPAQLVGASWAMAAA